MLFNLNNKLLYISQVTSARIKVLITSITKNKATTSFVHFKNLQGEKLLKYIYFFGRTKLIKYNNQINYIIYEYIIEDIYYIYLTK